MVGFLSSHPELLLGSSGGQPELVQVHTMAHS